MLITCVFNLRSCNTSDFVWFYDLMYGNCYKFNHELDEKFTTRSGLYNGKLLFNLIDVKFNLNLIK